MKISRRLKMRLMKLKEDRARSRTRARAITMASLEALGAARAARRSERVAYLMSQQS